MSYVAFQGLGQGNYGVPFQGLGQAGELALSLEDWYAELRSRCIDAYGDGRCNAVLPRNLVYAVTREDARPTIPWWGWVLVGGIGSKIIL